MIRQRVLYVGIGGTGLDLGVHLHEALQREVCGPDGQALNRNEPFTNLPPNHLPSFIQFLLLDFAQNALNGAEKAMEGGNVTVARNIIPQQNSYPAVAMQLRLNASRAVQSWIPPVPPRPHEEPPTRPYTAGAGQYPTVGRAALFSAMLSSGYEVTIGNDIRKALRNLGQSLGDLNSYCGGSASEKIAVYVGFSLSGGTGAGLFLDVIQLLIHELETQLRGNAASIIPVVYLPSTFEGSLAPALLKRCQLNCAQGLLDLTGLVTSRHTINTSLTSQYSIDYPSNPPGLITNGTLQDAPTIPVVSVVSKSAGMSKDDLGRAVAASVVAQLSYDGERQNQDDGETKNDFSEDLINKVSDISRPHRLGLGTHSLMPMIAASLTVPTQRIADIISKNVLVGGLKELNQRIDAGLGESREELVDELLSRMGFREFVDRETFAVDQGLSFAAPPGIKTEKDLNERVTKLVSKMESSLTDAKRRIEEAVQSKTTFSFAEAMRDLVTSRRDELSIADALAVGREALDRLEFGPRSGGDEQGSRRTATKKSTVLSKVLPKRLSAKTIQVRFDELSERHSSSVAKIWWDSWSRVKTIWYPSLNQGREFLSEFGKALTRLGVEFETEVGRLALELDRSDSGVVNYVPLGGRTLEAQLKVIEEKALESVRSSLRIESGDRATLLTKLVASGDGWKNAIDLQRTRAPLSQVQEAILLPIRTRVQEAVSPSGELPGAMKGLADLLKDAVGPAGIDSNDTRDLIAKLGNLVPGQLLPQGSFQECRILVTYPGERNPEVEEFVKRYIALDGQLRDIVQATGERAKNKLEFTPTGRGDTLRVNINMVGQGILDHPEVREVFAAWASEISNPMSEGLFWRQRIGYRGVGRVFDTTDRDRVVAALVRGLAGGQVEVARGSLDSPEQLRILAPNNVSGALVETVLDVDQLQNFSSWPNVVNAFEKLVLSIQPDNDFRTEVIESMYTSVPEMLRSRDAKIPEAVYALARLKEAQLVEIDSVLSQPDLYGSDTIRALEDARSFWNVTFPNALNVDVPTAYYRTIQIAMDRSRIHEQ